MGCKLKILVLSDPHYDFALPQKQAFFKQDPGPIDAIIVAGDVANDEWTAQRFFELWDRYGVPKYAVPGNHDQWYGPGARELVYDFNGGVVRPRMPLGFHDHAKSHGFRVPDPTRPYEVIDGILLFSLQYEEDLTDEEIEYTVDQVYFPADQHCRRMPDPEDPPRVRLSVSHLAPNWALPTRYQERSRMYFNRDIERVLRAHRSPVHFFGHTHETLDHVLDGVRYVNKCVGYGAPPGGLPPLSSFVVDVPA